MEIVWRVFLLLKIIRVMCHVWVCNRIETDSFNAKMVSTRRRRAQVLKKMAAKFVCYRAGARLCTLRIVDRVFQMSVELLLLDEYFPLASCVPKKGILLQFEGC